eukprot:scaffold29358_cov19-Tisochrysis_lutea.AAC.1
MHAYCAWATFVPWPEGESLQSQAQFKLCYVCLAPAKMLRAHAPLFSLAYNVHLWACLPAGAPPHALGICAHQLLRLAPQRVRAACVLVQPPQVLRVAHQGLTGVPHLQVSFAWKL